MSTIGLLYDLQQQRMQQQYEAYYQLSRTGNYNTIQRETLPLIPPTIQKERGFINKLVDEVDIWCKGILEKY